MRQATYNLKNLITMEIAVKVLLKEIIKLKSLLKEYADIKLQLVCEGLLNKQINLMISEYEKSIKECEMAIKFLNAKERN